MREFYEITKVDFFDEKFAYNETSNDAEYSNSYVACPKCGLPIGSLHWLEPREVILSKPKYGDFISGNNYLVSETFKNAYQKSDLKGIKKFTPVGISKVRYMRDNSPKPPQYYVLELDYSFARVDLKKSTFKGPRTREYCELCMPFKKCWNEIKGIYIDDTNWGGEDIFHLHEMGGSIYASQKFVDFCLVNKFTNFKYVNTKEYIFPKRP